MPITSMGSSNCLCMSRASVPEVPGVRIGTVASLALRHYARAVSTRRVAGRLVSELQKFVGFYREQCERYGVAIPASHTGS